MIIIACMILAVIAFLLSMIVLDIRDIKTAVERIKHEFTKFYDDDTFA